MSKVKMDLSRFKKVAQDDKVFVLRHKNGHEIRVARSGCSAEQRRAFEALPLCKAMGGRVKRYADGTPDAPVSTDDQGDLDPSSPAQAADGGGDADTGETAADGSDDQDEQPAPAPTSAASSPQPGARPSRAAAPADGGNVIDVIGHRPPPPPPPAPTVQDLNGDSAMFAQDLQRGHITPETYTDLFAKKDTLGKIGTIFGLLLSGAGSGLTHTPNVMLEMMNRELDRDLEAQKASNTNAQNWYQIAMQHEMNKAQMTHLMYQNAFTVQQGKHLDYQNALLRTQGDQALMSAYDHAAAGDLQRYRLAIEAQANPKLMDLSASNSARTKAMLGVGQYLQDTVNKMPEGSPNRVNGQAILDTQIKPAIASTVATNNARTASQLALAGKAGAQGVGPTVDPEAYGSALAAHQAAQGNVSDSGIDDKKLLQMQQRGAQAAQLGITDPNSIMPGDMGTVSTQASGVKLNRATYASYVDSYNKLNSAFLAGKLNKNFYDAEIGNFETSLAKQVGAGDAHRAVESMFPAWNDWGPARDEKFRKTSEHFQINESNTDALDKYGLKTPFPQVTLQSKTAGAAQSNMVKMVAPDGSSAMVPKTSVKKYLGRGMKVAQ